jgi:ABC-type glycerol-3-phosphate transport system substrate-binding protein
VPYDLTTMLFYHRPDLLEELGVGVPTTWDELYDAHVAANEANGGEGGYAIGWGNTDWLGFSNFLWQAGGDFYDEDCNVTLYSDEAIEALEYWASLYDAGVTTDTAAAIEAGLDSGLYPMATQGTWITGGLDVSYPEMVGKWAASPFPAGPTGARTAFIGGRVIGIMSYSENVEAAFDLIKHYNTQEAQQIFIDYSASQNSMWIPPQTDFLQYIAYQETVGEALAAQLADAKGPPNCSGWEAATSDVTLQLQSVIFEGVDPEDALAEAAAIMEDNQ